ncbi:phycobiliprotein lyase [Synechococcus sp. R55.6]|uniref:phycobiliprotein lyase n=1 Tax=unclassified Synechococcus TaxID=2626047 RepID=UPI0039C1BFD4
MMTVMEFFALSAGEWMCQRTSHHLAFRRSEGGRSRVQIATLSATDPAVIRVCELFKVDPRRAVGAARVQWDGEQEWDNEEYKGDVVLVPIPDETDPMRGQLLRDQGYAEKVPVAGTYVMGSDGALTLYTQYEMTESEERIWFASPNLRLRASTVKRFGGFSMASFCSEVRKLSVGPSPTPTVAESSPFRS